MLAKSDRVAIPTRSYVRTYIRGNHIMEAVCAFGSNSDFTGCLFLNVLRNLSTDLTVQNVFKSATYIVAIILAMQP